MTLTFDSVIPGRRISGEPGLSILGGGIPGSPFAPRNDPERTIRRHWNNSSILRIAPE
ncbi:hypothetical protein BRAS3843_1750077 [Bradyrhizobium sp. STM 3843]|nr:hypothetical protein BRAS3843_1750077 [Bradyrhizobium sp. STM 3843]